MLGQGEAAFCISPYIQTWGAWPNRVSKVSREDAVVSWTFISAPVQGICISSNFVDDDRRTRFIARDDINVNDTTAHHR